MHISWAIALAAGCGAIMTVVAVRWLMTTPWFAIFSALPANAMKGLRIAGKGIAIAAAAAFVGSLLCVFSYTVSGDARVFAWAAGTIGLLCGAFIFLAALLDFAIETFKGSAQPNGLEAVSSQRVYDTGGYASANQIDAALRDEDADGFVEPKFDE